MHRRVVSGLEVVIAVLAVVGHNVYHLLPNEVIVLSIFGILSLVLRHERPRSLGFRRPSMWVKTVLIALATAVLLQLVSTFVTEPAVTHFTHRGADLFEFRPVVGNLKIALLYLLVIWTFAAFGEEFAYRGYILTRMVDVTGASRFGLVGSVLAAAVLFAFGHYYQGVAGVIDAGVTGLIFGTLFLVTKRNLWITILAHGFADTIALVLVFAGIIKI